MSFLVQEWCPILLGSISQCFLLSTVDQTILSVSEVAYQTIIWEPLQRFFSSSWPLGPLERVKKKNWLSQATVPAVGRSVAKVLEKLCAPLLYPRVYVNSCMPLQLKCTIPGLQTWQTHCQTCCRVRVGLAHCFRPTEPGKKLHNWSTVKQLKYLTLLLNSNQWTPTAEQTFCVWWEIVKKGRCLSQKLQRQ